MIREKEIHKLFFLEMEIVEVIYFTVEYPCLLIQEKDSFPHNMCGVCHT